MSAFKDTIAQVGAFFLKSICEVDSRNSRADDDHVVIMYGLSRGHDVGWLPRVRDCSVSAQAVARLGVLMPVTEDEVLTAFQK